MISRLLLTTLLASAGVLHLLAPQIFDPAIPFLKSEINLFSGFFEIGLAIFLWINQFKEQAAKITACWFLILMPVHLYVSIYQIPIMGIQSPTILWLRTILQFALYFWALTLQNDGWIISQTWSKVLFLHFEVNAGDLQKKCPYPIDLYKGKAIVSIVPFSMGNIRFPFIPKIPLFSNLLELNLRTYVKVNDRPAVYFFTLDANHFIGVLIARTLFSLPYRWKKMKLTKDESYHFKSDLIDINARLESSFVDDNFEQWATERYCLITKRFGKDMIGIVEHEKWKLQRAQIVELNDNFSREFIKLNQFVSASYAEKIDVRFKPFKVI